MKKILLAITGSIAAIKSFDLIKSLQAENFEVQCIVSKGGEKLCAVKALEAMTGFPVLGPKIFQYEDHNNPFEKKRKKIYAHLELSKHSVALVIAPCSANTLAKIAHGQADDFLTTSILAYQKPILIAPAMNTRMWKNSVVKANLRSLPENFSLIPPQNSGILACGEEGSGKMAPVDDIVLYIKKSLYQDSLDHNTEHGKMKNNGLSGKKILITLGGTQEKIDPVRYIGNFSSGKTGKIFAEKIFEMGGGRKNTKICVVQGTSTINISKKIFEIQKILSAQEMYTAMEKKFSQSDIVIFCAAVADFRIKNFSDQKIKKNSEGNSHRCSLQVEKNIDIAKTLAEKKLPHQIFIGFCLETGSIEDLKKSMIQKSTAKKFDIVFGNSPENFSTTDGKFIVYFAKEKNFLVFEGKKEEIFEAVLKKI